MSLKSQLIRSPILFADETGTRCEKRNDWVHVLSNEKLTLLVPHQSRGAEAQHEIFSAVTAGDHRQTPVTIKTMIRKGFMLLPKIRQKKAAESIDLKSDPIITKNLPAAGNLSYSDRENP
jgi:hypothetical protein